MLDRILNSETNIIITSLIFIVIALLVLQYMLIGILILLAVITFMLWDGKYIVPFLIITYLTITSDISENLRLAVNASAFIILSFKFIKDYGFDFAQYKRVPSSVKYFAAFTLLSMIASSILSDQIMISLIEVLRLTVFFYLMYIFYSYLRETKDVIIYINSLVTAGIILSLVIVYSFLSSNDNISTLKLHWLIHEGGYIKNVAAAGGIFSVTIAFNLAALFMERFSIRKIKPIIWSFLIIQVIALLLTNSRAAFLAVSISTVLILFILSKSVLKRITYSIAGISFTAIVFFPKLFEIFSAFIRAGRILENTRYYLWDIAFGIIRDNPVSGCGPGMFKFYIYKYLPVMLGSWTERQINRVYIDAGAGHAHNFLLYRASEGGIFGLLCAIGMIALFFYLSKRVYGKVKHNRDWTVIITTIIAAGIGLTARSFFESTGLLTNGWITRDLPFWILFIIVIFLYQNLIVAERKIEEI